MTPLHNQVFQALLPVLLANTEASRKAWQESSSPIADAMRAMYDKQHKHQINATYANFVISAIGIASGKKELQNFNVKAGDSSTRLVPMSVVADLTDALFIIVNVKRKTILNSGGQLFDFSNAAITPATDEQVEKCVSELTPAQLRTILSNDAFAPVMDPLLQQETELVADSPEAYDDLEPQESSRDEDQSF